MRKPGSKLFITFNPELDTDETYKHFVLHPPPDSVLIKTSYRDNPWLSDEAIADMRYLKETDPDEFEHVYEGSCLSTLVGAVFAEELRLMDRESRVTMIPYDRERPVDTYWDLGIGDATAIWFVQGFPFQWRFIDYLEGEGQKLGYYLQQLQAKGYLYGTHHLPHDGAARELGTGKSIEELMRLQGMNVVIVPRLSIADTINASRTVFNQCWFDGEHCADGLQALRHYVWPKNSQGIAAREPEHNWASHGASAFRYFAVGRNIGQVKKAAPPPRLAPPRQYGNNSWMG